jgi:hypothetical protein
MVAVTNIPPAPPAPTPAMRDIEARAKAYAEARDTLAARVTALNDELEAAKRAHLAHVKRGVARTAQLEAELKAAVEAAPALFTKPKTVVLHGIKIGYEKAKGGIVIEDEAQTCKLIRKRLPELAEQLIKVEETPLKSGLAQLTAQQLKTIACQVKETGDQVVVRPVDKDVDKLVTALLKGAQDEAAEAANANQATEPATA